MQEFLSRPKDFFLPPIQNYLGRGPDYTSTKPFAVQQKPCKIMICIVPSMSHLFPDIFFPFKLSGNVLHSTLALKYYASLVYVFMNKNCQKHRSDKNFPFFLGGGWVYMLFIKLSINVHLQINKVVES